MGILKDRFKIKAEASGAELKDLLKQHGNKKDRRSSVISDLPGYAWDNRPCVRNFITRCKEGIRFRGYSIPELQQHLPKVPGGTEPLPEGLFYLMLIGELPDEEAVAYITSSWQRRSHVPNHVFAAIDALPVTAHPMTMFVTGIMALQTESNFARRYADGMNKKDYWDAVFDDSMDLIARLPRVAAYIYRRKYHNNQHIQPNGLLDWAGNLAHMLGFEDESFKELMRLYMTIHADHEGGNVSAHTTHLVGSALSDPYLSLAAGMNGLAGPLHGLANQEVVKWIMEMHERTENRSAYQRTDRNLCKEDPHLQEK